MASCAQIWGRNGVRFQVSGRIPKSNFRSFIEENTKENVVGFFRVIAKEMEQTRGILDFHLKVREEKKWFCVEVYFGDEGKGPEAAAMESTEECISCAPGAALFPGQEPGVTAGECVLTEFSDQPHVQCSLDAKARSGFIITPVRHVERMSQLGDDELFALWSTAVRALRQESLPFMNIALDHGTYRIHPHLRLKVWVDHKLHKEVRLKWDAEKLDLWNRLLALVETTPKKPCRFFFEKGYCRYAEECRFSHIKEGSET
ncbi:unnamed protein product [Calypogeia fissa]